MPEKICRCGRAFEGPRHRKWCSDLCRKNRLYGGTCRECGDRTSYSGKQGASRLCFRCSTKKSVRESKARGALVRKRVEQLWAEGLTTREIAAVMGWTRGSTSVYISQMRSRGYDLPYRNPGIARRAKRKGPWRKGKGRAHVAA